MADSAKALIFAAIDEMASDPVPTWEAPLNWAATVDALVDLILSIGGEVNEDQLTILMATAAMARRQSMKAPVTTIVISSEPYSGNVFVHVEPIVGVDNFAEMFPRLADALRYAARLHERYGWLICDKADREMVA